MGRLMLTAVFILGCASAPKNYDPNDPDIRERYNLMALMQHGIPDDEPPLKPYNPFENKTEKLEVSLGNDNSVVYFGDKLGSGYCLTALYKNKAKKIFCARDGRSDRLDLYGVFGDREENALDFYERRYGAAPIDNTWEDLEKKFLDIRKKFIDASNDTENEGLNDALRRVSDVTSL